MSCVYRPKSLRPPWDSVKVASLAGCGEHEHCHEGDGDEERGFDAADGDQEEHEHSLLGLGLAGHPGDDLGAGCVNVSGRELSDAEINELWDAWTPGAAAQWLSKVAAPWYVAAGWALELFTDHAAREHADLEIGVPAARFDEIVTAFPGFKWDVAGDGRVWPFPEQSSEHFQTWLREPATGRYRIDVFREPHIGDRWVCRRDASITLPYNELIRRTSDGIPYATPEVALLFKAKHLREKDEADFQRVLPRMNQTQRSRLISWLSQIHPGHPWIKALAIHTS
jgi:hypothetical protein